MTQPILVPKVVSRVRISNGCSSATRRRCVQSQNRPRLLPDVFLKNRSVFINEINPTARKEIGLHDKKRKLKSLE